MKLPMAATTCEDCGGKVNEQAWKCPHCGAKREGVTRGKLSNEEVRALVATDTAIKEEEGRSLSETLLYPHPETRGTARAIEIALTVACAPLVLVGIAAMYSARGLFASKIRLVAKTTRGEGLSVFVMTVFGAPTFWWVASALHVPSAGTVALVSVALLWVRAYIRTRTSAWKSRELQRLVEAEQRAGQPALPAARARELPRPVTGPTARPSAPAVAAPTAPRVDRPAAEPQTPASGEPRLLR